MRRDHRPCAHRVNRPIRPKSEPVDPEAPTLPQVLPSGMFSDPTPLPRPCPPPDDPEEA